MIAIDTNIVVRYITLDDAEQAEKARRLVEEQDIFVLTTVLLEAGWVLRSTYRFDRAEIARALRLFSGLPRVALEEPGRVAQARLAGAGHGFRRRAASRWLGSLRSLRYLQPAADPDGWATQQDRSAGAVARSTALPRLPNGAPSLT